jgi:sulfoxide reductase heme-binding subunit YedZ
VIRALVFILALLPALVLIGLAVVDLLGPDPGKALVLNFGAWALKFLLLTLAITPARRWLGWRQPLTYRRMMGLYTFFYASMHLLMVGTFLLGWSISTFAEEFKERPYMALGISAWLLLLPLAITSNQWMMKRLKQNWKRLHRMVYVIALLVACHYLWQIRSDFLEPVAYSLLIALLLSLRLPIVRRFSISPQLPSGS